MKDFFVMFFSQLCAYLLITINMRAIAHSNYAWTAGSNLTFAGFNYWLIKRIAKSESTLAWIGYTLGGVTGSMLGIFLSKSLG
jgi:hypothetical protein